MFEVEVKVPVADPGAVEARVAKLAPWGRAQTQTDTFFAHPDRDFVATDEALRLRRTDALELTYKGPRQSGDAKVRKEHNVGLLDDPTQLLASLGFVPAARLTKTRMSAQLDGCHIELDTVEGLGTFLEVEAVGPDAAAATAAVERVLERLGFDAAASTTDSYLELALAAGAAAAKALR